MLQHWELSLGYAHSMERVLNYLATVRKKRSGVECLLEGDGVFLVNIGHASTIPFKYYWLKFWHNAGSDEFPASEEYLKTARTTRVVKCADIEEAKLIGEAMYGDPLYANECIGKVEEVREATRRELDEYFEPSALHRVLEMTRECGGEVIAMNPITVRLPSSQAIHELILNQK